MPASRPTPYDDEPDAEGSAADSAPLPDWAKEHLEVLRDLREMGMQLARNLTRRVMAEAEAAEAGDVEAAPGRGAAPADPALSFSRISRAVRLTLALEARIHRQVEGAAKAGAANDDAPAAGAIDYEGIARRIRAKLRVMNDYEIRRAVEDTIEAAHDDFDDVERLKEELKERLDEDEVFEDRWNWPIGEAISLICQDLGLTPDWDRWENQGWAREEAEKSPPNSPYATVIQQPSPDKPKPTGTDLYRQARGLPPLTEPPPLRERSQARGPP